MTAHRQAGMSNILCAFSSALLTHLFFLTPVTLILLSSTFHFVFLCRKSNLVPSPSSSRTKALSCFDIFVTCCQRAWQCLVTSLSNRNGCWCFPKPKWISVKREKRLLCVCVCVCVRPRARARVCVCVCVCFVCTELSRIDKTHQVESGGYGSIPFSSDSLLQCFGLHIHW
jgi:hypothetical protein